MDCGKPPKDSRLVQAYLKTWRDVYESNGTIKQSLPSLKLCSECLVGHLVPVVRPSTAGWEFGTVHCYDECTEKHQFIFMDEDKEWISVEDDPFAAYGREFDQDTRPRPHQLGHHYHGTHTPLRRTKAPPKPQGAPSSDVNMGRLDEVAMTVTIARRADGESEVRTLTTAN
jgi:hypothetical protein